MSALVGLGAAGIGGQLNTLGRDLDHLPAAPDRKGHAQLPVSLDHSAASCNDGPINRRSVPNDALDVTRWSSAHVTSSIRLLISSHVASFRTSGSRAPVPCATRGRPPDDRLGHIVTTRLHAPTHPGHRQVE